MAILLAEMSGSHIISKQQQQQQQSAKNAQIENSHSHLLLHRVHQEDQWDHVHQKLPENKQRSDIFISLITSTRNPLDLFPYCLLTCETNTELFEAWSLADEILWDFLSQMKWILAPKQFLKDNDFYLWAGKTDGSILSGRALTWWTDTEDGSECGQLRHPHMCEASSKLIEVHSVDITP